MHRRDVRVRDRGRRSRFAEEAAPPALVGREVEREHLERDRSPQAPVDGLVDDPHAARAEPLDDAEVPDGLSDQIVVRHALMVTPFPLGQLHGEPQAITRPG